jgi:hypothetical protein
MLPELVVTLCEVHIKSICTAIALSVSTLPIMSGPGWPCLTPLCELQAHIFAAVRIHSV